VDDSDEMENLKKQVAENRIDIVKQDGKYNNIVSKLDNIKELLLDAKSVFVSKDHCEQKAKELQAFFDKCEKLEIVLTNHIDNHSSLNLWYIKSFIMIVISVGLTLLAAK